ncbi:DUF484 family protein [Emcibacter nanhaiensis]|uniref:DUF484 family protein n=1 Tax=Emcibacter nanhaiensis TaxID=1505037 RepID=A0A501PPC2_9PROT|nr:DUF484 family protein [Emcibacter nanhaiensis]TPD61621.1 DUF484 family protein [Emcibacter nanhaiensis]
MPEKKTCSNDDLTVEQIRDWLKRHPDFLVDNPDLLTLLTPPFRPSSGDRVVDFQQVMLEKLQQEIGELKNFHSSLIDASRNNMSTQQQVHEAALALMQAGGLDQLSHILVSDWPQMLSVDVIAVCFEEGHKQSLPPLPEVRPLKKGQVDDLLGREDACLLRGDVEVLEEIFGPATELIKAEALIRIPATEFYPEGLLAFGSRDPDMFTPGQGTELLRFLEAAFGLYLQRWMKRTSSMT